jgi:hypothetical protein
MKPTLAILFAIVLLPAAFAASGTGTDEGMAPMRMMAMMPTFSPPVLDCNQATGTVVAIDVSKAQETDDAQTFVDDLNNAGYYVATVDLSTQEGQDSLSCVDVLIIWSLVNNYGISGTYSNSEVDAIEDYVRAGGGFFFLSDHSSYAQSTANLIARFGIVVDANYVYDYDNNDGGNSVWPIYGSDNFITSPLFDGVDGYEQLLGTSFVVDENSDLVPVVITDNDASASPQNVPVVAAGFYDSGCMVVTGDTNWLQEFVGGYEKVDNGQFAMNTVDFLTRCDPGDVNVPEFGIIAAAVALVGAGVGLFLIRKRG